MQGATPFLYPSISTSPHLRPKRPRRTWYRCIRTLHRTLIRPRYPIPTHPIPTVRKRISISTTGSTTWCISKANLPFLTIRSIRLPICMHPKVRSQLDPKAMFYPEHHCTSQVNQVVAGGLSVVGSCPLSIPRLRVRGIHQ